MTAKLPDTIFALLVACGSVAFMWTVAAAFVVAALLLKGAIS